MPFLAVNGAELHYDERGAGARTIVFSHGLLWSGAMYEGQIARLSDRYRCVAYDHRGQGESKPSPAPYDMETLAEDAAALIDKLGAAPCHFVGLSMGGFVGLRLALRRRELLRSLVLIDSAADAEPRWNVPKYRAMGFVARHAGLRLLLPRVMKAMFGRTFLRDAARAEERRRLEAELLALDPVAAALALRGVVDRAPVEEQLADITTPTLVLSGAEDAAVVPARSRQTARRIPGARFAAIARAGHSSSMEEPEAVATQLASFFVEVRERSTSAGR
jgi:pimeloyl-ACP methyl ester carboxylesterase